jgi:hypothetical protein
VSALSVEPYRRRTLNRRLEGQGCTLAESDSSRERPT